MNAILIVCFFTFLIHVTETMAYTLRLAGTRTGRIAIALSFVTSTLLVSRLSNMFQAPILGALVDGAILAGHPGAIDGLIMQFRWVIFSAFLGAAVGMLLTPTCITLFTAAIRSFAKTGSLPKTAMMALRPRHLAGWLQAIRIPKWSMLKKVSIATLPKSFLILNLLVASIYTIGVLCALLAGALAPEFRSTAIQLSGIVNGLATIMFTLFVDPAGARITDEVARGTRPENDIISVVFFLQMGRLLGTLIIAQLLLLPFTHYILKVTLWLADKAI
jgi:hypothetical protein